MKTNKITWISFLVTLSALTIPHKTIAHTSKSPAEISQQNIENRLTKIARVLQEKEQKISQEKNIEKPLEIAGGWIKGSRPGRFGNLGSGGFVNRSGGGSFLNNRGWSDRGGFLNRR